jgi:hypothetical protein
MLESMKRSKSLPARFCEASCRLKRFSVSKSPARTMPCPSEYLNKFVTLPGGAFGGPSTDLIRWDDKDPQFE